MEGKKKQLNKVKNFMSQIGFSHLEAKTYLKLLEIGPSTITEISSKTNIPRSTLKRHLDKLINKGVLSSSTRNNQKRYIAENPKKIGNLLHDEAIELEDQMNHINVLQDQLPNMIKDILNFIPQSSEKNNYLIQYYQGWNGFKHVCNRSIAKADKEILQISNCTEWRKIFTKEYSDKYYVPNRLKKKIKMRALVLNDEEGKKFQQNDRGVLRSTRFLPMDKFKFNGTMLIYKNEASIMLSSKPYIAILLQNKEIYLIFKNLFENLWKNSIS